MGEENTEDVRTWWKDLRPEGGVSRARFYSKRTNKRRDGGGGGGLLAATASGAAAAAIAAASAALMLPLLDAQEATISKHVYLPWTLTCIRLYEHDNIIRCPTKVVAISAELSPIARCSKPTVCVCPLPVWPLGRSLPVGRFTTYRRRWASTINAVFVRSKTCCRIEHFVYLSVRA